VLTGSRLLGERGIPKLRKEAPRILKFKGKGHEYRDAERLLSYYQHWADELFRKGKFRDTLSIIEKIGHSRTMKWEREAWLMESREGKPKDAENDPTGEQLLPDDIPPNSEELDDAELYSVPKETVPKSTAPKQLDVQDPEALFRGAFDDSDEDMMGGPDDDELEALLAAEAEKRTLLVAGGLPGAQGGNGDASAPPAPPPAVREDKEFEDEMDEMMSYMD
jgi:replication fork protection complex subunit Csm3/Swi3